MQPDQRWLDVHEELISLGYVLAKGVLRDPIEGDVPIMMWVKVAEPCSATET